MGKRVVVASFVAILAAAAVVASASAAKPTFERITIDEIAEDEFLSEACGVPVTTQATGHILIRTFEGEGAGPAEVLTVNVALTAMAGENVYRFRDVGADVTRITPDGTAIVMIIGQLPFQFTGVLKIDLATGEAILEPRHLTEAELEEACAVLSA